MSALIGAGCALAGWALGAFTYWALQRYDTRHRHTWGKWKEIECEVAPFGAVSLTRTVDALERKCEGCGLIQRRSL